MKLPLLESMKEPIYIQVKCLILYVIFLSRWNSFRFSKRVSGTSAELYQGTSIFKFTNSLFRCLIIPWDFAPLASPNYSSILSNKTGTLDSCLPPEHLGNWDYNVTAPIAHYMISIDLRHSLDLLTNWCNE